MSAILHIFTNMTWYVLQAWRNILSFQWHVRQYMNQLFRNRLNDRGGAQNCPLRSSVPKWFDYEALGKVGAMTHENKLNIRELRRRILIVVRIIIHAAVFRMLARSMDARVRCIQADGGHCEQHVLAVKYVIITVLNPYPANVENIVSS